MFDYKTERVLRGTTPEGALAEVGRSALTRGLSAHGEEMDTVCYLAEPSSAGHLILRDTQGRWRVLAYVGTWRYASADEAGAAEAAARR